MLYIQVSSNYIQICIYLYSVRIRCYLSCKWSPYVCYICITICTTCILTVIITTFHMWEPISPLTQPKDHDHNKLLVMLPSAIIIKSMTWRRRTFCHKYARPPSTNKALRNQSYTSLNMMFVEESKTCCLYTLEVATDEILCLDGVWITVVKSWEVNNPMAFMNPSSFLHPEKLTVLRLKSNLATKRWQTPM